MAEGTYSLMGALNHWRVGYSNLNIFEVLSCVEVNTFPLHIGLMYDWEPCSGESCVSPQDC